MSKQHGRLLSLSKQQMKNALCHFFHHLPPVSSLYTIFFFPDFLLPLLSSVLEAQQSSSHKTSVDSLLERPWRQLPETRSLCEPERTVCSIFPTSAVGVGSGFNTWNRNYSHLLCSFPSASCTFSSAVKGFKSNKETPVFLLFLHWKGQFYNHPYCQSGTKEEN